MAQFNVVRSAMRLSAVFIAAGTVLGLSSVAAAQSRVERAEKALQQAQRELEQARAESRGGGQGERKELRVNVTGDGRCEVSGCPDCPDCPGDQAAGDEGQNEMSVTVGDDDDDDQPRKNRIERRIEIRRDGGEGHAQGGQPRVQVFGMGGDGHPGVCPLCGGQMRGNQKSPGFGAFNMGGQPHVQVFGLGGDGEHQGHAEVHSFGKAIVIGPDGQRREFNFGDGQGGGGGEGVKQRRKVIRLNGGGEGGKFKIEGLPDGVQLFDGPQGGEQRRKVIRLDGMGGEGGNFKIEGLPHGLFEGGEGHGAHGMGGGASGKVIIVGPDGQRREFNFGGDEGGSTPKARKHRIEIQEDSDDGDETGAHLPGGAGFGGGQRTITVRRASPAV